MRLTQLHLIFICIATAIFISLVFAKWQGKNEQIKNLNKEILAEQEKIAKAEKIGNRALAYVRINRGLNVLAGKKLSEKQKEILTHKLLDISNNYKIDPILILAVIRQESRGNPNARGAYLTGEESGAFGLMQIKYESALEVANSVGVKINSLEDLFVPEKNLMVGTAYLLKMIAKYKNMQYALIAYNVGFGTLNEKLKSGEPLPKKYYNGIMKEYKYIAERIYE